jgi:hypothetical protein
MHSPPLHSAVSHLQSIWSRHVRPIRSTRHLVCLFSSPQPGLLLLPFIYKNLVQAIYNVSYAKLAARVPADSKKTEQKASELRFTLRPQNGDTRSLRETPKVQTNQTTSGAIEPPRIRCDIS